MSLLCWFWSCFCLFHGQAIVFPKLLTVCLLFCLRYTRVLDVSLSRCKFPTLNSDAFLKDISLDCKPVRYSKQRREKWRCLMSRSENPRLRSSTKNLRNFSVDSHLCFHLLKEFFLFCMNFSWRMLIKVDKGPRALDLRALHGEILFQKWL